MVGLLFAQAQLCAGPDLDHIRSSWGPTAHLKVGPSAVVKQTGYTYPMAQMVKHLRAVQKTQVQSLGRSPGEGNGNPLQYPCLENAMDRGAWWAAVHEVTESGTNEQLALTNFLTSCDTRHTHCYRTGH